MNEKLIALYANMMAFVTADREDEKGATAVEYGLLVALIAGAIIITVTALGGALDGLFERLREAIAGA
ncbi:Flp family type IVb pilin [Nocardioides daejeonensis]|uniref:Flp family type IVb pilin n=1 Tax=Nocardioides daejeonensis TaxID=1046556 RepID=UPI001EF5F67E|nr:Flp family type IVb pilin [Nocardioides daejeonensis]